MLRGMLSRGCALLVAVAGCGRFNFAPVEEVAVDAPPGGCPAPYTATSGGCYRAQIDLDEVDWGTAEARCEADGPGAHLIVIDDDTELAVAVELVGIATDAWVGATDRVTEGSYLAVTGGPAFVAWAASEPDGDVEDCVRVFSAGGLGDRGCGDSNDYLCEYDGRPVVLGF